MYFIVFFVVFFLCFFFCGFFFFHYEKTPIQVRKFFSPVKTENFIRKILIFFLFLLKAVLTSTHNLCFGAKIRKIGIPLHTPVLLYKSKVQGGKYYTEMFS